MPSLPPCNSIFLLTISFLIMATSVDPLIIGRVIGDVVDMFVPSVNMSVYFGTKHVTNGCHIKPSMAVDPPRITLTGNIDNLYTLVMTDPDAPSPSEPIHRELIHWIVTNIPGGTNPNQGNEILPYGGPRPPLGIHRYILVLFEQKGPLDLVEQPPSRASFNTRYFARQLNLGLPVATVYFNSQKEPAYRRRT
ncbi:PREDICTED: protein MOTHER of FT and TFL1-like [Lupinus angustifolius]|uniref:protein MOTHER of FT and TFL1-like n=1 Tax=Lupinus angustifolius TaxID=3871 RepID=UPI00092FA7F9|nr:PREDICTED: protein MOTHER of FT and TFL1-like [Lupinus angustifolius]